jgi:hypothetical protein
MGVIYRAYDRVAEREVAYKRLQVSDELTRPRRTALFQNEYETLLRLSHPNMVEVYDFGEDRVGPYYAMELLTGQDLTDIAPLPFVEACRLLRDIASALALLHARQLIHRDVSPNNIRLTSDGRAKLIDFGALMPFGLPKELVGTPPCIAPECLDAVALDQRSDLYSFGAVAYWALTQRMPVRARTFEELARAWDHPPPPPSTHVPTIPKELDELVLSLLSVDPMGRPASAAHVIDRLTAIAELEPEVDERRVAASYLARPPLCGRDALIERTAALTDGVQRGHGCAVLIEGSAGVGRSALLEMVAIHAQRSGSAVLRARPEPGGRPFALATKLLEASVALYPELDRTLLRRNFGTIHAERPPPGIRSPVDAAEQHAALLSGAEAFLLEVARQDPLVVIVDDVHVSDAESLALLASLARSSGQSGIALFVSTLSGHAAQNMAAERLLAASAERWMLGPFTEEDVIELMELTFGGVPHTLRLARWLHTQSAGNPASCLDLARLLLQRGVLSYRLGTFILPYEIDADLASGDLADAMLARLGDLSPTTTLLASVLSLHDGALTPEQLASVAERPLRDVQLSLDELNTRGVVVKTGDSAALPASSLRRALKEHLGEPATKKFHVRLAHALLASNEASVAQRLAASQHLIDAGEDDDAARLMASIPHDQLIGEQGAQWIPLFEATLAIYKRQKRSAERCLSMLLPLVYAGYFGDFTVQQRYIGEALASLSNIAGISLARRLRPYVGEKLALGLALLWTSLRRAFTPKGERLGSLRFVLHSLTGLVSNAVAAAASAFDAQAAVRYAALLEPFRVLPKNSGGYLMREFSIATAEVGAGRFAAGAARYEALVPQLTKPGIDGIAEFVRLQLYLGCLNGQAQAAVALGSDEVLDIADELGRGDAFFAPHAEVLRVAYYSTRGEHDRSEAHRALAERLALRGGSSWSAVVPMTAYLAYSAMFAGDAIRLEGTIADIRRLGATVPRLKLIGRIAEAWLDFLRGRVAQALSILEQTVESPETLELVTWRVNYALYATALNAAGQHGRAKEVCLRMLKRATGEDSVQDQARLITSQLALAEAGLGNAEAARKIMDEHFANLNSSKSNNPLELGATHRDAALIALLGNDLPRFEHHLHETERHFRATRNPALLAQCESLKARVRRENISREVGAVPGSTGEEIEASTMLEAYSDRRLQRGLRAGEPDNDTKAEEASTLQDYTRRAQGGTKAE